MTEHWSAAGCYLLCSLTYSVEVDVRLLAQGYALQETSVRQAEYSAAAQLRRLLQMLRGLYVDFCPCRSA